MGLLLAAGAIAAAGPASAQSAADSARAREQQEAERRAELDRRDGMRNAMRNGMANPGSAGVEVAGSIDVPSVKGHVAAMRFFESGPERAPRDQRRFASAFDAAATRFVALELEVTYPAPRIHTAVAYACTYRGPGNRVLGVARDSIAVDPGETSAFFTSALGWREAGQWRPGGYRVTCEAEGRTIAEGGFEIRGAKP